MNEIEICLLALTVLVVALVFIAVSNRRDMWALHKKIMEMNEDIRLHDKEGWDHRRDMHSRVSKLERDVEPLGRTERFT